MSNDVWYPKKLQHIIKMGIIGTAILSLYSGSSHIFEMNFTSQLQTNRFAKNSSLHQQRNRTQKDNATLIRQSSNSTAVTQPTNSTATGQSSNFAPVTQSPDATPAEESSAQEKQEQSQQQQQETKIDPTEFDNNTPRPGEKIINFFSPFENLGGAPLAPGRNELYEMGCPVTNCFAISDPELQNKDADAYVMYNLEMPVTFPNSTKPWRKPHQTFVFLATETPQTAGSSDGSSIIDQFDNFFNYTMTYRSDSDLRYSYGFIRPRNSTEYNPLLSKPNVREWPITYDETRFRSVELPFLKRTAKHLLDRPNDAAWIVSNCIDHSMRKEFVRTLTQNLSTEVHVYGNRGRCMPDQRQCDAGSDNHRTTCVPDMERKYKFYFGLENSFCEDYVTEKAFNRMAEDYLVVVMGQADYTRHLPPHSYINVLDFESIDALASHLDYLTKNETAYLSYFWWKQHYTAEKSTRKSHNWGFCELCEKLNNPHEPAKTYESIRNWWYKGAQCGRDYWKIDKRIKAARTSNWKQS